MDRSPTSQGPQKDGCIFENGQDGFKRVPEDVPAAATEQRPASGNENQIPATAAADTVPQVLKTGPRHDSAALTGQQLAASGLEKQNPGLALRTPAVAAAPEAVNTDSPQDSTGVTPTQGSAAP